MTRSTRKNITVEICSACHPFFTGKMKYVDTAGRVEKFQKNPEKYVPAFGGMCAFGQSIEKEFEPDPTSYKIVGGRLFLFLKNDQGDALQLWSQGNESELIERAERHFAKCAA